MDWSYNTLFMGIPSQTSRLPSSKLGTDTRMWRIVALSSVNYGKLQENVLPSRR